MKSPRFLPASVLLLATVLAGPLAAQAHDDDTHSAHMQTAGAAVTVTEPGQAAYGAIAEVVRVLEADPATDWTRVDLERLRQHLIDMDLVTLEARAEHTPVPGGVRIAVTGEGRVREAIVRMTGAHAHQLDALGMQVSVAERPDGVVMTVTTPRADDAGAVARIRGLGFAGLMALGNHHAPHHLAMARGAGDAAHGEEGDAE